MKTEKMKKHFKLCTQYYTFFFLIVELSKKIVIQSTTADNLSIIIKYFLTHSFLAVNHFRSVINHSSVTILLIYLAAFSGFH